MLDTGILLFLIIMALGLWLAFMLIYVTTKILGGPEYEQWRDESKQWEKSHPIRAKLLWLPPPFNWIVSVIGPRPPKMQKNEEKQK